jgi:hypothetical protein
MHAVSPVIPDGDDPEQVIAENHPVYMPLPALRREDGIVLTRWRLDAADLEMVIKQGYLYVSLITSDGKIQPLKLTAAVPPEFENFTPVDDEWATEIDIGP